MELFGWLLRCVPGLSTVALLLLIEYALQIVQIGFLRLRAQPSLVSSPVHAQVAFCVYSTFIHLVAAIFPLRLIRAVKQAARAISAEHVHLKTKQELLDAEVRTESRGPRSSSCRHVIIVPCYKESIETIEDTLSVLAQHEGARPDYDIFLAMEERDPGGLPLAQRLVTAFTGRFLDIQFTIHPSGLPHESAGKSSNVSWAAKEVERKYHERLDSKEVLVTIIDSDAHLLNQHFRIVSRRQTQLKYTDPFVLYVPPIVFDRNAHVVPRLVRMADMIWCGAGLSCYNSSHRHSRIIIPTAVYTLTLNLVQLVGGWDTGPGAIGEDMHMMLKCYFATHGQLRVESIASPASLCNVSTSKKGIRGWIENHGARYTQALRHMWGALDTGYAIGRWLSMGSASSEERIRSHLQHTLAHKYARGSRFSKRTGILFIRLFEAHLLPIHLVITIVASEVFGRMSVERSWYVSLTLHVTGYLRTTGIICMFLYFAVYYEKYHQTCIAVRQYEVEKTDWNHELDFSHRNRWSMNAVLDYLVFPVAGLLYGGLPLLQAVISHFWTEDLVYLVSAKPTRAVVEDIGMVKIEDQIHQEGSDSVDKV